MNDFDVAVDTLHSALGRWNRGASPGIISRAAIEFDAAAKDGDARAAVGSAVARGLAGDYEGALKRLVCTTAQWPEFAGAVTVAPLAFPGSIKLETLRIPDGQTESKAVLSVEANAPPREYSLTITAQGQVPFTTESDKAKGMRLVTLPSRTLTVVVLPAVKK